jgi:hypothetical protein
MIKYIDEKNPTVPTVAHVSLTMALKSRPFGLICFDYKKTCNSVHTANY